MDSLASALSSEADDSNKKLWTSENTRLLISLVAKYENEFQTSIKKFIWQKIAKEIVLKTGTHYNYTQLDTKWKGLQKTYKDILTHNSETGRSRKTWEFFETMHDLLFKRPEINAVATCSSTSGLVNRKNTPPTPKAAEKDDNKACLPENQLFESTLNKKRKKATDAVERRHKEKMERLDKYLKSFDRLVSVLEKNHIPENSHSEAVKKPEEK